MVPIATPAVPRCRNDVSRDRETPPTDTVATYVAPTGVGVSVKPLRLKPLLPGQGSVGSRRRTRLAGLAGLAALLALAPGAQAEDGPLHVPSPDWREAVIYFAMIDRFDDGDPSNSDQGVGEYDPAQGRTYSGGDLRGLTRRLDYVQGLGATALWITPPVANQWWNPGRGYSGYHGYWASDFSAIDAHYGTKADYQALSRALHGRGMH